MKKKTTKRFARNLLLTIAEVLLRKPCKHRLRNYRNLYSYVGGGDDWTFPRKLFERLWFVNGLLTKIDVHRMVFVRGLLTKVKVLYKVYIPAPFTGQTYFKCPVCKRYFPAAKYRNGVYVSDALSE